MTDLAIDRTTGDLTLLGGDLVLTQSVAQACAQRLQLGLGIALREWFLDLTEGIPYREQVLVRPVNLLVVRSLFVARILRDPDVVRLTSLTVGLDPAARRLEVSFSAQVRSGVPGFDDGQATVVGSGGVADGVSELLCLVEPMGGYL